MVKKYFCNFEYEEKKGFRQKIKQNTLGYWLTFNYCSFLMSVLVDFNLISRSGFSPDLCDK